MRKSIIYPDHTYTQFQVPWPQWSANSPLQSEAHAIEVGKYSPTLEQHSKDYPVQNPQISAKRHHTNKIPSKEKL